MSVETPKSLSARKFFSEEEQKHIVNAIKEAENKTSGEIRLYVEDHCEENELDKAAFIFSKLDMQKTQERNGVLFYLAVKSKKFAIIGDVGINSKVPENFWEEVRRNVFRQFVFGNYSTGLINGINVAGGKLKKYFPVQPDDVNELPDDIMFGDSGED